MKDIQETVHSFTNQLNIKSSVNIRILDLISELGELSKEYLKATDYGCEDFTKNDEWDLELGDVFFSLICIANETNSNLEESLNHVLNKYQKRLTNKGHIGSNN